MEWTLEVVNLFATDLDRAKEFYADRVGFKVDLDTELAPGVRIIQLTPPGSRCSVALVKGMGPSPYGTAPTVTHGLQLCVTDITAAHAELSGRGVDVSPVVTFDGQNWTEGTGGEWNSWMFFTDPDGNSWTVQEAPSPLRER